MTKDVLSFIVYMIHACANKWGVSPSVVYKKMQTANCITNFLVPNYEILHTQSTQYIVEDINDYLNARGILV
ncbi:DUF3791 domain-containing protein [Neglecta sp. X4]|uniref:DUF3791 domain-containing protein n=2 Tax=Eubacteriales TaxID=186802 RepID=A0A845QK58_9FIRM|nr:DUF3791 domain-containing protein [Anaerotruncus colihominis]NBJ74967.1 DUF3791 domain-containing protein [Neglectibacter sp. X4]NCF02479.1 DUF3791 domain-containing protein [Anaerotruncus sp. 80]